MYCTVACLSWSVLESQCAAHLHCVMLTLVFFPYIDFWGGLLPLLYEKDLHTYTQFFSDRYRKVTLRKSLNFILNQTSNQLIHVRLNIFLDRLSTPLTYTSEWTHSILFDVCTWMYEGNAICFTVSAKNTQEGKKPVFFPIVLEKLLDRWDSLWSGKPIPIPKNLAYDYFIKIEWLISDVTACCRVPCQSTKWLLWMVLQVV